jgi:type II secretory pathway component PulF
VAIFRYEAADARGTVLRGAIDALNAQEAIRRLTERGYHAIRLHNDNSASPPPSVAPSRSASAAPSVFPVPTARFGPAPPKQEDLALFCRQMASLLHAGFTPAHALADLGPRTTQRRLSQSAYQMGTAVANGASLAGEMTKFPTLFPPHVAGLVAAGEQGGFLPFAFEEAALNAEQDAALKRDMWLTKFLIWQSIWSVLIFQPLFPSINPEDIKASAVSYFLKLLFIALPLGVLCHAVAEGVGRYRQQPAGRPFFDRITLRIPVMGHLAKMRAMASFTRVLSRLLRSGVSAEPAFVAAAHAVPNTALRDQILQGAPLLRAGQGLDAAIQASGVMDNDPFQLLVTGQKTGQWVEMLDRVTAYYQEMAQQATEKARSAQKRVGVLLTIITSGYVMIYATYGLMKIGLDWTNSEAWQP